MPKERRAKSAVLFESNVSVVPTGPKRVSGNMSKIPNSKLTLSLAYRWREERRLNSDRTVSKKGEVCVGGAHPVTQMRRFCILEFLAVYGFV